MKSEQANLRVSMQSEQANLHVTFVQIIGNTELTRNLFPNQDMWLLLTHISPASLFLNVDKQCRPRSDAAERGVWSGSSLFA